MELHGGQLASHSAGPYCGSTFVVTLPAARALTAPIKKDSIPALPGEGDCLVRVMVVEDNVDGAATMQALLCDLNAQVRVAGNGEEALAALQQFTPELVLSDIGLPGMSGYELATRLRSIPGREVQLVALTGYGSPDDKLVRGRRGLTNTSSSQLLDRLVNSRRSQSAKRHKNSDRKAGNAGFLQRTVEV